MPADCQGGRGGRTRRIENVQGVITGHDVKVLHQISLRRHGLGTNASSAGSKVLSLNLWNETLKGLAKALWIQRLGQLGEGHRRVAPQEAPQAREGDGIGQIVKINVTQSVAFA